MGILMLFQRSTKMFDPMVTIVNTRAWRHFLTEYISILVSWVSHLKYEYLTYLTKLQCEKSKQLNPKYSELTNGGIIGIEICCRWFWIVLFPDRWAVLIQRSSWKNICLFLAIAIALNRTVTPPFKCSTAMPLILNARAKNSPCK